MKIKYNLLYLNFVWLLTSSCKKLVQVDPPTNTIISEQAFRNDYNASTAILGLYSKLVNQSTPQAIGNGGITILVGVSSDETAFFGTDVATSPFYKNQILPNNTNLPRLWSQPYAVVYAANACIEQLQGNNNVTPQLRAQLIAEAKFVRAYCYFYLMNMFGDVPFITNTNYNENTIADRTTQSTIYNNIVNDLESSVNDLPQDFATYNDERIRATRWAGMALLARLYLYTKDWDKAILNATNVISNSNFSLADLNNVFLKNSSEAILQLSIDGKFPPYYNLVPEANFTIPLNRTSKPYTYLPLSFINEFESGDKRRNSWVDSTKYLGKIYYIPYKYKNGPAQKVPNSTPVEYYMVLRLAEQYLIRAEGRAQKGDLAGAASDLNTIRARAGLGQISFSSLDDAISNILAERKHELFYEWGNRWFDLKRTGKIDSVMAITVPQKNGGSTWSSYKALFPIPAGELILGPNLRQNSGY